MIENLKKWFRFCCNIYLNPRTPKIPNFDPKDKNFRQKYKNHLEESVDLTTWDSNAWRFSPFCLLLFFRWFDVILGNAIGICGSFLIPYYLFKSIEKDPKEGWRVKSDCIFVIPIIWVITGIHAWVIFLWDPTTVMTGVYLRIALISICIFANICSTAYIYIKYIRAFKGVVNEKTGKIWTENEIWSFSSTKFWLFYLALLLVSLAAFGIGGIKILPTYLNIGCMITILFGPRCCWESTAKNYCGPKMAAAQVFACLFLVWSFSIVNAASMLVMHPVFNIYIIYLQKVQIALCFLASICATALLCYRYRKEFVVNKAIEGDVSTSNDVL